MQAVADIRERMAFVLTEKILRLLDESGASQEECGAALRAAQELMPETVDASKPGTMRL